MALVSGALRQGSDLDQILCHDPLFPSSFIFYSMVQWQSMWSNFLLWWINCLHMKQTLIRYIMQCDLLMDYMMIFIRWL
jgi:hypothetical protein